MLGYITDRLELGTPVRLVAKRLLLAETTAAPQVAFTLLKLHIDRLIGRNIRRISAFITHCLTIPLKRDTTPILAPIDQVNLANFRGESLITCPARSSVNQLRLQPNTSETAGGRKKATAAPEYRRVCWASVAFVSIHSQTLPVSASSVGKILTKTWHQ